ncbi:MAG: hypothetical protein JW847_04725 [Candidatus Omnitrophica bacterium]|nr:hypothetical protein [Candidatus Omnitrophota bacterium]
MKKIVLLTGIIIGCFLLTAGFPVQPALAAEDTVQAGEANLAEEAEEPRLMPIELDGTEWVVEVTSINKKGEKVTEEDTLMFKNKQFVSKLYEKEGHQPTNYSLTVSKEDVTNFGTMQIKDKETSFWKGRVVGEVINGSLHIQYEKEGENETKYFKGNLSSGTLKRKEDPNAPKADETVLPPVVGKSLISTDTENVD